MALIRTVCTQKLCGSLTRRYLSTDLSKSIDLKDVLQKKICCHLEKVKELRSKHGALKVSEVTVNMIYGGMRGIRGLICETSVLDPVEGIKFREFSIPDCQKCLPKATGGNEPLPEGLFWLLMTGDIPNYEQANAVSREWACRATLPDAVIEMLCRFPKEMHPMAQFSCAVTALSTESKFAKAVACGAKKDTYWQHAYEDCMDLCARVIVVAGAIYVNTYKGGHFCQQVDKCADWSANLCQLMKLGNNEELKELMRLYLTIHSDHEGGNVSAHAVHLVGSALSDPYLSFAAGMNGLAGPLHGLANQEVLVFINKLMETVGSDPTEEKVKDYVQGVLKSGRVVPGYGHAVLRKTDPRYTCQAEFAERHLPDDPMLKVVKLLYKVVPPVLTDLGKVQNPWPNVDAHSGVLLQYFGVRQMSFYTVLFGVSRAVGTMASLVWSRAMGLPIERPKSLSTDDLLKMAAAAAKKKVC